MESKVDRYLTRSDVCNHLWNKERVELWTSFLVGSIVSHLFLECADTANTHAKNDADIVLVNLFQIKTTVFHALHGGNHCQLGIAVKLASFLTVNKIVDVEVFHLASKLCLELGAIERCNRCSTAYTLEHVLPSFLRSVAQWSNGTETCYYYSFKFHYMNYRKLIILRSLRCKR